MRYALCAMRPPAQPGRGDGGCDRASEVLGVVFVIEGRTMRRRCAVCGLRYALCATRYASPPNPGGETEAATGLLRCWESCLRRGLGGGGVPSGSLYSFSGPLRNRDAGRNRMRWVQIRRRSYSGLPPTTVGAFRSIRLPFLRVARSAHRVPAPLLINFPPPGPPRGI